MPKKTAPASKKKVTKKTAKKKTAVRKKASKKKVTKKASSKAGSVTPEQRYTMIAEAAYYIAEKQGFAGDNTSYWLEAEAQIEALLD